MTEPNDGLQGGLMEHVQRILVHGLGALRCYITLLAAEGERRGRRLIDQAMWVRLLAGNALPELVASWLSQGAKSV